MTHDPLQHFTFAVFEEFTGELVKLRAWYAWWLFQHTDLTFREIIDTRVSFFRRRTETETDQDHWLHACRARYEAHGADADTGALEAWVLDQERVVLTTILPERYEKNWIQPLSTPYFGFSCAYEPRYGAPDSRPCLTLHFRNWFVPDTPFRHAAQLTEGLRLLVARARAERPEADTVQCATWLNRMPPFAALFPRVWSETRVARPPAAHMGWWGQFMGRTGQLHAERAAQFRATGEFPYRHCRCKCAVAELAAHLGI